MRDGSRAMGRVRFLAVAGVLLLSGAVVVAKPVRKARADRNKDGTVDARERHKAIGVRAKIDSKWERRADRDHDGYVEPVEARRAKHVLDRNDDGHISAAERTAFWSRHRVRVVHVYEEQYDSDGSGYIEGEELRDWLCARVAQVSETSTIQANSRQEKMFDTNNDGLLDNAEAQVVREELCE